MDKKSILFFVLMSFFTGAFSLYLYEEFAEEYDVDQMTKVEAVIVYKVSEKSLFRPPSYFARVLVDGESPYSSDGRQYNRISKQQAKRLSIGDTIQGYTTDGKNFASIRDFLFDSMFYIGSIVFFAFLCLFGLFVLICHIPFMESIINQAFERISGKWVKRLLTGVFVVIIGYFSLSFMTNVLYKASPFGKTKVEAQIIDRDYEISYHRFRDSSYHLTLRFQDKEGKTYIVVKEVTRSTYKKYFNTIPISYRNRNPLDVFVADFSLMSLINVLGYGEFYLYMLFLFLFLFFIFYYFKRGEDQEEYEEESYP